MNDADRICAKLDHLTAEQGRTREEFAQMRGEVTAKIEGLGDDVSRLGERLTRHEEDGQARQLETAERLTKLETRNGDRATRESAHDLGLALQYASPPLQATPSLFPSVIRAKWKAIAAIAATIGALVPLAWFLLSLLQ